MHAGDEDTTESAAGVAVDHEDLQTPVSNDAPGRLPSLFALGIGVCVTVANIALLIRIWKFVFARTASGSLLYALIIASFVLGIFLIVYGVLLGRPRTPRTSAPSQSVWYVPVVASLIVGAGALVFTIWAANVVEPDKPAVDSSKACIDLYQQSIQIHQASALFRFPASDPDQRRCDINGFLKLLPR